MKKIPLLIILTCLVLSGCNGNTENLITDSNFDSNTVTVDETAESTSDYINTEIIETTAQTNQDVTAKDIISVISGNCLINLWAIFMKGEFQL